MKLPAVIGLSGTFASGKDTLAEYLVGEFGYTHVSTGDMIRVEAMKRYGDIERPTLVKVGAELRAESGSGVLAKKALEQSRPVVITGVRAVGEAEAIKSAGGVMVFVDADPRVRYERMISRSRDSETELSFDEFLANEEREIKAVSADTDQNIGAVRELCDISIDNSGSYEEFFDSATEAFTG